MYQKLHQIAEGVAKVLALTGGVVLLLLVVLNTVSIIGRALIPLDIGIRPIRGIYDMTEIGMAVAIFAFLPWAQFQEAHARVDLFQRVMPRAMQLLLELVFNAAMAAFALLMTWRLYLGMNDKLSFGETTLIAQIPVWWGYAGGLIGAIGFAFVALFCVVRSGRRMVLGKVVE